MCGIVGYIGETGAKSFLLQGLEKLEYRGYDSAGIALTRNHRTYVYKEKGRIADLRKEAADKHDAAAGIGHTRWATHGGPNRKNAHPHQSESGRFTIVHNGVIENYKTLAADYLSGIALKSETDTEVVVQLIQHFADKGMSGEDAFRRALSLLQGSYAVAMLDAMDPETVYIGKHKSPLLVGIADGCRIITSDAMAALNVTNAFVELMDGETAMVGKSSTVVMNREGETVHREALQILMDAEDLGKGPYPHYMLKEIDEQPLIIRNLISKYTAGASHFTFEPGILEAILASDRIYMIACGTSYHAALAGKQLMERVAGIPVESHIASEFLYHPPLLSKNPLFVFISQSGETADNRGVLVKVKQMGLPTVTVTNVRNSTLSREADYALHTYAGSEIAVASTKAYTAQVAVLALLAGAAAEAKGIRSDIDFVRELGIAAGAMEILIHKKELFDYIVWKYLSASRNCFFIGRGMDYYACLEGALKLKEISYIQAEGFAGGELKHGTIALIEDGTPVIALVTQGTAQACLRSNVEEVAARGADVCLISMEGLEEKEDQLILPAVHDVLTPLVSVVAMQFIAYYAALYRGCDIDKPRNLAKSVTVE